MEGDAEPNDEAESQMRRALGLLGDAPRHRADADRPEPSGRTGGSGGGGGFNGGLHRRRFVQDGDVPVTVLRRDPGLDVPNNRIAAPVSVPSSSRLQRTEAALAAESAARDKAERSLSEAYAVVKDLQTKIGHAELAKNEALDSLRREREAASLLRSETEERDARVREAEERAEAAEAAAGEYHEQLVSERHARKIAEKALRAAEAARDEAEQLLRTLSEEVPRATRASAQRSAEPPDFEPKPAEPPRRGRPIAEPEVAAAAARRQRSAEAAEPEPEPVKWWLNTKPGPKRR
jgi:hypothetical protein